MQKHILQKLPVFTATTIEKASSGLSAARPKEYNNPYTNYEKIRQEAYDAGLNDGRREIEEQKSAYQKELETALSDMQENFEVVSQKLEESHANAIKTMLASLLPILAEQTAGQEIAHKVSAFAKEASIGKVTLIANPKLAEELEQALLNITADFVIKSDASMSAGAIQLDWEMGQCQINVPQAINACLTHIGIPTPPDIDTTAI